MRYFLCSKCKDIVRLDEKKPRVHVCGCGESKGYYEPNQSGVVCVTPWAVPLEAKGFYLNIAWKAFSSGHSFGLTLDVIDKYKTKEE